MMRRVIRSVLIGCLAASAASAGRASAADKSVTVDPSSPPPLHANQSYTLLFPEMPATFYDLADAKRDKSSDEPVATTARLTFYLPRDYDPSRKHSLLIFLQGGRGSRGDNTSVARKLAMETNFVCVDIPLLQKTPGPAQAVAADCQMAWPLYKMMFQRLETVVPNIDADRRVLGGFSNGAFTTGCLMAAAPDGEAARYFSACFLVDGGGVIRQNLAAMRDKPLLMMYGGLVNDDPRRVAVIKGAKQVFAEAQAAGVKATLSEMAGVGHAFPDSVFPVVRDWLRDAVLR